MLFSVLPFNFTLVSYMTGIAGSQSHSAQCYCRQAALSYYGRQFILVLRCTVNSAFNMVARHPGILYQQ